MGIAALSVVAGCAAPPGTPGAGVGRGYTPLIDMQGVDGAAYQRDVAQCRSYAGMIDADSAALTGAVVGAILGAAVTAGFGLKGKYVSDNAAYGVGVGATAAGGKATFKQERIMSNCMAGRGYRVLDAGVIAVASPPPYIAQTTPVVQPIAYVVVDPTSTPLPVMALPEEVGTVALSPIDALTTRTLASKPIPSEVGQWSYEVEHLPVVQQCNRSGIAKMTGKGPGLENYSVNCTNGDILAIRCEIGKCRVLR